MSALIVAVFLAIPYWKSHIHTKKEAASMLELKGICKTFNPNTINAKVALNHLNLTLNDGDFVTVIGGNGAGKSTMLNAIAGVFQVDGRLHHH